ncbi:MAG: HDIG domain-containing protein [Candidatus Heimdallarchaeum endolithica]|uniref:HDIG domain-containing protein n=1 Tax=Candidatus Heimdallarchaeum endolithica TaxID=2876572 RepID=A0A9Y1BPF2_9ARCH|nr:MAG: HDIG domain-containing protein [Candidatus Heimdallarchaeum endolithica]
MQKRNKHIPSEEECYMLLRKYKTPPNVVRHCEVVTKIAKRIASPLKGVNLELVVAGAMLHDIGRSVTHSIFHAIEGVKILEKENISEKVLDIVKKHIGTGIPKKEAKKLGLPEDDYVPKTIEEEIVSFADNCSKGENEISFEEAKKMFVKKFGHDSYVVKGFERQKNRINTWKKKQKS